MKQQFVICEMSAVLAIATRNYMEGSNSNLLMAIPNAVIEWESDYRKGMHLDVITDDKWKLEVEANIRQVKSELTIAFQFPLNFIQ